VKEKELSKYDTPRQGLRLLDRICDNCKKMLIFGKYCAIDKMMIWCNQIYYIIDEMMIWYKQIYYIIDELMTW
jgi:uncharacterized protein YhbP (UPF0306 family)